MTNKPSSSNASLSDTSSSITVLTTDVESADPEGETITSRWNFLATPEDSQAELVNETPATPSFTADVEGQYIVQLVVTDATGQASEPDVVVITTQNQAPTTGIRPNATTLAFQIYVPHWPSNQCRSRTYRG